jgi:hypothetical protein
MSEGSAVSAAPLLTIFATKLMNCDTGDGAGAGAGAALFFDPQAANVAPRTILPATILSRRVESSSFNIVTPFEYVVEG